MLISAKDAIRAISEDSALIMDATFVLPNSGRDAFAEYLEQRIPHAVFFDINKIADDSSPLPHTMPDAEVFTRHMSALGLDSDQKIILYDQSGMLSAARAWWMLRYFGHDHVVILDGGMTAWIDAGGTTESGVAAFPDKGSFIAKAPDVASPMAIRSLDDMVALVATPPSERPEQIIDARSSGRFSGKSPEPRPGMASGHMPGALSCPISHLIDADTGRCKSPAQIMSIFSEAGIDLDKPVVTSCGSGVTACGLAFGFALIGKQDVSIYDGSWSEWGSPESDRITCPVVTE
ncbi:MAG: sulfurtransferase [Candidatus Puniceispirillales bacterium]